MMVNLTPDEVHALRVLLRRIEAPYQASLLGKGEHLERIERLALGLRPVLRKLDHADRR